jgi:hypothetical protein
MTHLGVLDFERIIDKYKDLSGIRRFELANEEKISLQFDLY